ncbi:hypothetical protein LZ31DRAFT_200688 [Colletotrichum somersetense]|nr:hypothetical protein LZ31DRAFT_200688 [Colletotrichum somersetense]
MMPPRRPSQRGRHDWQCRKPQGQDLPREMGRCPERTGHPGEPRIRKVTKRGVPRTGDGVVMCVDAYYKINMQSESVTNSLKSQIEVHPSIVLIVVNDIAVVSPGAHFRSSKNATIAIHPYPFQVATSKTWMQLQYRVQPHYGNQRHQIRPSYH